MVYENSKSDNLLLKCPTGISGFDEITEGGLPLGRPALVCGGPGCGKTLFAMEFLVRGAIEFGEPGVFMSFEERENELVKNVKSLGFDLLELEAKNLLRIDQVLIERSEIEDSGAFDLEGIFVRLEYAIDQINAKRVVLDTVESIFAGLPNPMIIRSELKRLFLWLKDKGVTAIITGEQGDGQLTRQGLEEYVSDSVTLLDHRVINGLSTRRLRVVKYRGSTHGSNEYPFLITKTGFSILPVTSLGLKHSASRERISTGIADLDLMFGGEGVYRGSSVLISGMAGTAKTSIAASFAQAACRRGERALYFGFEESEDQFYRNMESIGVDLKQSVNKGLFRHRAVRPMLYGLEMHLIQMYEDVKAFQPSVAICDPLSAFLDIGTLGEVKIMLTRLIDHLKTMKITAVFTTLASDNKDLQDTEFGVSSLIDSWLKLAAVEQNGERNRSVQIIKSRGMKHSNKVREFYLTENGIFLEDVYVKQGRVLTGSAREEQLNFDEKMKVYQRQVSQFASLKLEKKKLAMEGQIDALRANFEIEAALAALDDADGKVLAKSFRDHHRDNGRDNNKQCEELQDR